MSKTQALRNALHIPFADPNVGEVVTVLGAGDAYSTEWKPGAAGTAFPNPDKPEQLLVSGPGPGYLWTLIDGIDAGTF
jgi:hypothetical protein